MQQLAEGNVELRPPKKHKNKKKTKKAKNNKKPKYPTKQCNRNRNQENRETSNLIWIHLTQVPYIK